jgi:hypothetical protein
MHRSKVIGARLEGAHMSVLNNNPGGATRGRRPRTALALAALSSLVLMILGVVLISASPASAYQSPAIWVGSPVAGQWGESPWTHHTLYKASPQNDWATDIAPSGAGQGAYLYVAPSNSAYNGAVTTKISQIIDDSACRYGGGGDLVTVQIFYNGTSYGQVTYAHLDRNPNLYVGQWVGRWGTWLGNVANLWDGHGGGTGGSNCWTGPHVHTELRATTQYACWNKGYVPYGSWLNGTNFIGFVSGPLNYNGKTPCP